MKYSKLRLRKKDQYNWVIEGFEEGGGIISRGPHQGKTKKGGWQESLPIGYFSTLKDAATRLLDEHLKLQFESEVPLEDILQAIQNAKNEVIKEVNGHE